MKGLEEIKKKALNLYNKPFFRSKLIFKDDSEFPLYISLQTPSAKELLDNFSLLSETIDKLKKKSKEQIGFGYNLRLKEMNSRSLGKQKLPHVAIFNDRNDFLIFLGKKDELAQFQKISKYIIGEIPLLSNLLERKTDLMKIDLSTWEKLILTCKFFLNNLSRNYYLRSLEIEGVDSKFIENNKKLISLLLDEILPEESVERSAPLSDWNGFEKRYGLKHDLPKVRLKFLDEELKKKFGNFSDIQVTIDDLEKIEIPCARVIVAENKTNGLVISNLPSTIVIFGLGNGVGLLKNVSWLNKKRMAYWGDIDTWGFSILSNLRKHFPHTKSLLMDKETFNRFQNLATEEPNKAEINETLTLHEDEMTLYKSFLKKSPREKTRLEQERIPLSYCLHRIDKWINS